MRKTSVLAIFSSLVILAGLFFVYQFNNVSAKKENETLAQDQIHNFAGQLNKTLEQKEGARITKYKRKSPESNTIIMTIEPRASEHNDKQTNDHIRDIVENLAKDYELNPDSIKTKIKTTR